MALLKTINEYFDNHLPILIDTSESDANDASLDWYGIVHLHQDHFFPETCEFYRNLLHEFIHLDRLKTSGSVYGYGGFKPGENLSYETKQKLEDEINRGCDLLMKQDSLVFRVLKDKLKSANFVVEKSH